MLWCTSTVGQTVAKMRASGLVQDPLPPEQFGRRLTYLLGAHGIAVRPGAERLNVSPTTLQKWRSGADGPSYRDLRRLSEMLGENPANPNPGGPPPRATPGRRLPTASELDDLVAAFDALEQRVEQLGAAHGQVREEVRHMAARLSPYR